MPDIEIFGPVPAGEITAALRSAPYADKLTFIRNSKNVTGPNGAAQSFVRISASFDWPDDDLADIVRRLHPIIGVETTRLTGWHPKGPISTG